MNRRIRDFILALCIIGTIACYVAESFVTKQPLHHQLDKGGFALVISTIVVWLVL